MIDIQDELRYDFLAYADEVNNNRAFPDAVDGLKPVQRSILWEMYTKGYSSNKPHVKSAKITGGVIGMWSPHSDSATYEAMVGMSQPWIRNIPEVDWHGGNGSMIGGAQAASARYTEARLSQASEQGFFSNIKYDVVDMIPNFSEDAYLPKVFPAIFPRLYVNGSSGIGYTISNDWLPGNLIEFKDKVHQYFDSGDITTDDIYPDFPTGGIIVNKSALQSIADTGKGTVVLRAKTEIKGNSIIITELPYQVYAEPLIAKIKELVNGGKIDRIDDIMNKSDSKGLLIEIVCTSNPNEVLSRLFRLTDLQCSLSVNQMAVVGDYPILLNLKDYIKVYCDSNLKVIFREHTYILNQSKERLEVVDGLIKAIGIIDDVIKTIKASKTSSEAVDNMQNLLSFTERQAQAIVDMRLSRLCGLELGNLVKEQKKLDKTILDCTSILNSEKKRIKILLSRLDEFTDKFGWQRRTEVVDIDLQQEKQQVRQPREKKKYVIVLTTSDSIKKVEQEQYRKITKGVEQELDSVTVSSSSKVAVITNFGFHYRIPVNKLTTQLINASGTNVNSLLPLLERERILGFVNDSAKQYVVLSTRKGYSKKMPLELICSIQKMGRTAIMKLSDDDEIYQFGYYGDKDKVHLESNLRTFDIKVSDIREKGRAAGGTPIIRLKKKEILK